MKTDLKVGDTIKVINVQPLKGKEICPPLKMGEWKEIKQIIQDSDGNEHFDVGLESIYSYISSFETGEHLPNGDKIHWCHPSRFEKIAAFH